jgi:hypothetical protein
VAYNPPINNAQEKEIAIVTDYEIVDNLVCDCLNGSNNEWLDGVDLRAIVGDCARILLSDAPHDERSIEAREVIVAAIESWADEQVASMDKEESQ